VIIRTIHRLAASLLLVIISYSSSFSQIKNSETNRLELAKAQSEINPEKSLIALDKFIKESLESNSTSQLVDAYYMTGKVYNSLMQPSLAIYYLELAQSQEAEFSSSRKLKSTRGDSKTLNNVERSEFNAAITLELGIAYQLKKDFKRSNAFFHDYLKKLNHDDLTVRMEIASNSFDDKNYKTALLEFEALLEKLKGSNEPELTAICKSKAAACLISLNRTDEGLDLFYNSIPSITDARTDSIYGYFDDNFETVGNTLRDNQKYEEEIQIRNYRSLVNVDPSVNDLKLAQAYFIRQNYSEAENSLDNYLAQSDFSKIKPSDLGIFKSMALHLKSTNQTEKALNYLLQYESFSDSLYSSELDLSYSLNDINLNGNLRLMHIEKLKSKQELKEAESVFLQREVGLKADVVKSQKVLIYVLLSVIFLGSLTLIYVFRVAKQRRIANQKLALRSLRSQMNPHFIFNALNSVNSFISNNDERSANKFLTDFSNLMRTVMENSEQEFIALDKELEILNIYTKLEQFRFKDKFNYCISIPDSLDSSDIQIPPMLIQPFVENAIWHGLRYKESEGLLNISFDLINENLKVEIVDNGIGRTKSRALKTKNQKSHKSSALKNIESRILLFNEIYKVQIQSLIRDKEPDGTGTVVTLIVPQKHLV